MKTAEAYLDIGMKILVMKAGAAGDLTGGDPDSVRPHHSAEALGHSRDTVSIQLGYFVLFVWMLGGTALLVRTLDANSIYKYLQIS